MKSPVTLTKAVAGFTNWAPLDYISNPFAVGLGFSVDSAGNLTAKVQHTFDELAQFRDAKFGQSTTTVTITDAGLDGNGHGLITGDCVEVIGSSGNAATTFDGTYEVTVSSVTVYTITVTPSQTVAAGTGNLRVSTQKVFDHSTLTGLTARADGNYAWPVKAIRLNITSYTAGRAYLDIVQGR